MAKNDTKVFMGVHLPEHEQHMCEWIARRMREHPEEVVNGKGTYQYHKLTAAMEYVRGFRVAVDIGAHVGFWSMHLARRFEHIHAFEPVKVHRKCYELNLAGQTNYTLYPIALGETAGMVDIATTKGSSGDSRVVPTGDAKEGVTLKRLDDVIDRGCADRDKIDFVKVDCEGYEIFALRGGEELLLRNRPCVIVEQKPGFARRFGATETGAVSYLQGLGAVLRKEIGGDFIMSWDVQ